MVVKIGYEMLTFVSLTKEQLKAVEDAAGYGVDLYGVKAGLVAKGSKAKLYDMLCELAIKYDIELI